MRISVVLLGIVALAGHGLRAQWSSYPFNSGQPLQSTRWLVVHDATPGIVAFSAIAQRWELLSPPGATLALVHDTHVVTRENTTTLRAWNALTNETATQSVSSSVTFPLESVLLKGYAAVFDGAPGTAGWLRAYSAFTNTWASVQLSQPQTTQLLVGANCAVMQDGLNYHAYSPYTGQWVTLTLPVAGGAPFVGSECAGADLRGTSGPFQYAAFSSARGRWSTSPVYSASGAGPVASIDAAAFAIRVDTGVANEIRYVAYSPFSDQWVTSPLTHTTTSTQNAYARPNILRVEDSNPNARFESFGAVSAAWQSVTGTGLTETALRDDCHIVKQVTSATTATVHVASGLVGGGYQALPVPDASPAAASGNHQFMLYAGTPQTLQAWGYSAATNTFSGPVPIPQSSTLSSSDAVSGFVPPGTAPNAHAMAFSLRHGSWRQGPAVQPGETWTTFAAGGLFLAIRTAPSAQYHVFDEHRDAWLPPVVSATANWIPGWCPLVDQGNGNYLGYSVQRGEWAAVSGVGTITTPGGYVTPHENLSRFTDSTNQIRVFAAPPRAQTWAQWPLSSAFSISGAQAGGAVPTVGVSARGAASQYGLLYASLALAPSPIVVPAIGGALDLDPIGAVQVADLGFFDADGVSQARIPIPPVVASFTKLWFQLVTVNFATMQIEVADRASGTTFF